MGLTAYKKYEAIQIFSCISEITMVDILENSSQLPGVEVEETVIRRYNDSIYFPLLSDISGKCRRQLERLRQENTEYGSNDLVGKSGIEMVVETGSQRPPVCLCR